MLGKMQWILTDEHSLKAQTLSLSVFQGVVRKPAMQSGNMVS